VVSIAGGRVRADAVEVVVGDGHAVRGACSQDEVLTADARSLLPLHCQIYENRSRAEQGWNGSP
jgi:hypothetical protein